MICHGLYCQTIHFRKLKNMFKKLLFSLFCFAITFSLLAQNPPLNMSLEGTWDGAGEDYNDIWGYVDDFDNEYAIIGSLTEVHFVDVTNPTSPAFITSFSGGASSAWRDIKTYDRYAYSVADVGAEGLMIFDLTDIHNGNITQVYQSNQDFDRAHNIYIDVPEARLYIIGSRKGSLKDLIVYDLSTPDNPILLKVFNNNELAGGYIHDAMARDNILYASSGNDGLFIFDLNDLNNVITLGSVTTNGYNHSSWITDDGDRMIIAEEVPQGLPLLHYDISDFSNLTELADFKDPLETSSNNVTYHNPYIIDDYVIISSYYDGVTIFDISTPGSETLVAHYDTYDNSGYSGYNGCWGTYPYLPSGIILGSDIQSGLFVLSTTISLTTECGNGVQDHFEQGVDCGGFCHPCPPPETIDLTKTADVTEVSPGGIITYTLAATNSNSSTYNNIVITDPIPANTTYVASSASNGGFLTGGKINFPAVNLNSGASHTVTFQVKVDPTISSASSINDDVENGNTLWTATATNAGLSNWEIDNSKPNGGTSHWFADDVSSPNDQFLTLTDAITPSSTTELRFFHLYNTEEDWDGGRVQISVEGGAWTDLGSLMTQNGYNGILDNSSLTPGFSGNSGGYLETVVDLSTYDAQSVQIRFFMHCDQAVGGDGWYIDDISITNLETRIPNTATVTADGADDNTDALDTPTLVLPATCSDAIQNGDETGVDCGGTTCTPCSGGGCPPDENYTGPIITGTYSTSNSIISTGTIASTENVIFLSNEITLDPDFLVELGGTFMADSAPCMPFTESDPNSLNVNDYEYFDLNFEFKTINSLEKLELYDEYTQEVQELSFSKLKSHKYDAKIYINKKNIPNLSLVFYTNDKISHQKLAEFINLSK